MNKTWFDVLCVFENFKYWDKNWTISIDDFQILTDCQEFEK